MAHMQHGRDFIYEAASHLMSAARAARHRGGADPLSLWHAFAGQLELTAAGLAPDVHRRDESDFRPVVDHLRDAASALESIPPLQGPPDLAMWVWHVAELRRLAEAGDAQ
jgi:hypothetical protein